MQKFLAIGNLGQDVELRKTQTGKPVANFSIAVTEKFKDKQGQQQENTEWINCVAWSRKAEVLAQYLVKGSKLYIEGKMQTRDWEDNGVKKYKTEVIISEFQFLGGKQDNQQQQNNGGGFGEAPQGFDNQDSF